jgi:sigma-B regulation protein RsbU (phosphoserine phosphatase)
MTPPSDQGLQERYQALLTAARNLLSLTDLEDLINRILRDARTIVQAEACSLYLPDAKTKELIIYSSRGAEDKAVHAVRLPWNAGIAGSVFHNRKKERIDDVQNDPRFLRNFAEKIGFTPRSMLCMPLTHKEECFGVLQTINPLHSSLFSSLDENIFEGLASIVTGALLRLDRESKMVEESRLIRELDLARDIQKSFLPPQHIIGTRGEIHVEYQPARTIGGDFYAAYRLINNRVLFALGDVSGKGIPAALTTAQVAGELNALAGTLNAGLKEWAESLNRGLCGRLPAGRFVATTFALFDAENEQAEVLCAGQFAPWRRTGDQWTEVDVPRCLPLGISAATCYQTATIPLLAGDCWLFFTDGINEGRNGKDEDYGFERMKASLLPGSPRQVLTNAWKQWRDFVVPDDLHDDACLAVVAVRPEPVLHCTSEACHCKTGRDFIEQWTTLAGLDDMARGQIVLAIDEAFTNIIRHTYNNEPGQPIEIHAALTDTELEFRLRDYGPVIDPEKLKGRALEDIKPGGLGLFFLNRTFPHCEFITKKDGNELVLRRPLPVSA